MVLQHVEHGLVVARPPRILQGGPFERVDGDRDAHAPQLMLNQEPLFGAGDPGSSRD